MGYTTLSTQDELTKKWYDNYYKKFEDEALAENDKVHNQQRDYAQNLYGTRIKETEADYEEELQRNEVQKYINEKQLQENMANLGLTDSGLNRTQQTAVQLSYANNKANTYRQRQSAVDALAFEMDSRLADIETSRFNAATTIKSGYQELANTAGANEYKSNLEYVQKAQEAEEAAANKLKEKENAQPLYDLTNNTKIDNEITWREFVNIKDGTTVYLQDGSNPYTKQNNKAIDDNAMSIAINGSKKVLEAGYKIKVAGGGEIPAYDTFDNGYQPKGIVLESSAGYVDLGKVKKLSEKEHGGKYPFDELLPDGTIIEGKPVTVWYTGSKGLIRDTRRYWFWSGIANSYIEISYDEDMKKWIRI